MAESRVIPNGVDTSVFRPGDRGAARAALGLAPQARILLFAANGIRENQWKDFSTLRAAVLLAAARSAGADLLFLALGEDAPPLDLGRAKVLFIPRVEDPGAVARYYQAADLYVHAARADTFPTTVIEALACGTPVVATAVGGIPEQVRSGAEGATGVLVPPGDPEAFAGAVERLLSDDGLRSRLARNAAADARERFSLDGQVKAYLDWYAQALHGRGSCPTLRPGPEAVR